MPTEWVTIETLAEQENERLNTNIKKHRIAYAFANNSLSLISTGITGFSESRRAFGAYLSQINISLCLALLSALRQHKVQVYTNLRLALEHTALAAYSIVHPEAERYFSAELETPINHEKLMRKNVYPWLTKNYPRESKEIKELKRRINDDHSHAKITHAYRNMESVESDVLTVQVNYMDFDDDGSLAADLIHVGHVGFIALTTIAAANANVKALRFRADLPEETQRVRELGRKVLGIAGSNSD